MSECAPAFDPARDPPDSLYGFTRAEWSAAAQWSETVTRLVAGWDRATQYAVAGELIGLDMGAFVALARLSTDHARRVIARLDPGFTSDYAAYVLDTGPDGEPSEAYLRRVFPYLLDSTMLPEQRAANLRDLQRQIEDAAEIFRLAQVPVPS